MNKRSWKLSKVFLASSSESDPPQKPRELSFTKWNSLHAKKHFLFKKDLFFYWPERERAQAGGAQWGTRSQDPGIMTWAEGSRPTNWVTQVSLKSIFLALRNVTISRSFEWIRCVLKFSYFRTTSHTIFFLKAFICKWSLHPAWGLNSQPWDQESQAPLTEPARHPPQFLP